MGTTNFLGGILFWIYILVVLVLLLTVLHTVYYLPGTSCVRHRDARSRFQQVFFAVLAFISLEVLCCNMLSFFALSYRTWAAEHAFSLPTKSYGNQSILEPNHTLLQLWKWSTTTSQFQDYTHALIADPFRYVWTGAGLWCTFFAMWFIGVRG